MLAVHYLDLTNSNEHDLAVISEQIQSYSPYLNKNWVFLKTCHRIEFYTNNPTLESPIALFFGVTGSSIIDTEKVIERMLLIACGVLSKITAESCISQQFQDSVKHSIANDKIKQIFSVIALESRILREKYQFWAVEDYNTIALKLLYQYNKDKAPIIIVGGGMLARFICEKIYCNYRVVIITRNPRRLRKSFNKNIQGSAIEIIGIDMFDTLSIPNYVCFIATSNYNHEYCSKILPLLTDMKCKAIIDFSAVPQFNDIQTIPYITMYNDNYLHLLDFNNISLKRTKEDIINEISQRARSLSLMLECGKNCTL